MLFEDTNGVIKFGINAFETTTGIKVFSLDNFENKAQEYEKQYPGQGFQRAYEDTLGTVFKEYVAGIARDDVPLATLSTLVYSLGSFIMKPYVEGAKKNGINANIDYDVDKISPKTFEIFDDILEKIPVSSVMQDTYRKFEKNELTLDSVSKDVKARKNTVPTKEEALELVSRAAFLEERMESRGKLGTFLNWYTALREYFTIKALKSLAEKALDTERLNKDVKLGKEELSNLKKSFVESLDREAQLEKEGLAGLRKAVDAGLINAGSKKVNERIENQVEIENALDSDELDENEIKTEIDFEKVDEDEVSNDFASLGEREDELGENSDLSQIDEGFSLDDDNPPLSDTLDTKKVKIVVEGTFAGEGVLSKFEKEEDSKTLSNDGISLV